MSSVYDLLRLYNPHTVEADGYPAPWHHDSWQENVRWPPIKDVVRELAEHRCVRCGHPYRKGDPGISPAGKWSPCDARCAHDGPARFRSAAEGDTWLDMPPGLSIGTHEFGPGGQLIHRWEFEAKWRILTVHHLNGVKWDCRWWNLASLCQRCHLSIQGRVIMDRVYPLEHTDWFKPYAAGWYAASYLGEELTREEVEARLDELLALERQDVPSTVMYGPPGAGSPIL